MDNDASHTPDPLQGARENIRFLSGVQALAHLPLAQRQRDAARHLNTAGFISGYRGSPLGGLDKALWALARPFKEQHIVFQPGVNEDMAATALWGSQQTHFFRNPKFDGVFGLWYGKGPGVDRSGDAIRHANLWGTNSNGGVIMAVGDDPMARSSSIQQQSELALMATCVPVFNAASVQDILDYGLIGWALSRFAGVWVGIKMVSDTAEALTAVDLDAPRTRVTLPPDWVFPPDGLNIRWPDNSVAQDERMLVHRLPAVRAFARHNRLNATALGSRTRRLGIITAGKTYLDTGQALRDLGIDARQRDDIGLAVFKVGLVWPLEPQAILEFARGLEEVLIVEEARAVLEPQVKDILYDLPEPVRPRVCGKRGRGGEEWFRSHGELTPALIARSLTRWLEPFHRTFAMDEWLAALEQTERQLLDLNVGIERTPYFCSGCPHNTSTKIPEGSTQLAGIGCHFMVSFMDRNAVSYSQMGGEGATWVGAAPFVGESHVFVNVGDGTYFHSGSMAIRQAIAGKVNATFKILYNDAVAMTGGQPVDGLISVRQITHELYGEGAKRIAVVSDAPERHDAAQFAPGTTLHPRSELIAVQEALRNESGVTVLIYEQTCATELRRRRKRKLAQEPHRRVFINERVCEGCGDCGVQSNCLSVQPLETEFGRKRTIDQSACNKDYSCLNGFCPSFVTVEGAELKTAEAARSDQHSPAELPDPQIAPIGDVFGVLVAGIGGTGVVTVASILAMAARAEGKQAQLLELTGLAQKFGAVYCHLKISAGDDPLGATRLSAGQTSLLIAADIVSGGSREALRTVRRGSTAAVVNTHPVVTGQFTRDSDFRVPVATLVDGITAVCGAQRVTLLDSTDLAWQLTGDTIGGNVMLLGSACQRGLLPVSPASIEAAIRENGVAVEYNLRAFRLGRLVQHDHAAVDRLRSEASARNPAPWQSTMLPQLIERRAADLVRYQNAAYAKRYLSLVERVGNAERSLGMDESRFQESVARNYYKLLAYKDEYEVARLHTETGILDRILARMDGPARVRFHFAAPLIARKDPVTGRPMKRELGAWILPLLRLLARLKFLRGTWFDPFGRTADRRLERELILEYERAVELLLRDLTPENHDLAVDFANVPDLIRGYGHVKAASVIRARAEWQRLSTLLAGGRKRLAA